MVPLLMEQSVVDKVNPETIENFVSRNLFEFTVRSKNKFSESLSSSIGELAQVTTVDKE